MTVQKTDAKRQEEENRKMAIGYSNGNRRETMKKQDTNKRLTSIREDRRLKFGKNVKQGNVLIFHLPLYGA